MNYYGKLSLDFKITNITYGNIISLWNKDNNKPVKAIMDLIKDGFSSDEIIVTQDGDIFVTFNSAMYQIDNSIETTNDQINVQIILPRFYYGYVTPNLFTDFDTLKDGDLYFDVSEMKIYTYDGSSWGSGQNIDDEWKNNHPDVWQKIEDILP